MNQSFICADSLVTPQAKYLDIKANWDKNAMWQNVTGTATPYDRAVWEMTDPATGELLAEVATEDKSTATEYLIGLLMTGIPVGCVLAVAYLIGHIWIGLIVAGAVFIVMILWRVQMGLFVMAGLIPWAALTTLHQQMSLVRAAGFIVVILGALHLYGSSGPRWPGMVKAAFALGLWAIFGPVLNPSVHSISALASLLSNILFMYLLMRFCSTRGALFVLLAVMVLSSASIGILGLSKYLISGVLPMAARLRVSEEINTNTYVRLLFPGIFLTPIFIAEIRSRVLKPIMAATIGICSVALIMTVARGAVLGALAGGVVFFLTLRRIPIRTKLAILAAGVVLTTVTVFFSGRLGAREAWAGRTSPEMLASGAQIRYWRWMAAFDAAREHPVVGVGMGNEPAMYASKGLPPTESHNDIISSLVMTGVAGMLCYLGVLVLGWRSLWRLPKGLLRSGLLAIWTALIVTGFFNPSFTKKIFWLTGGICAAAVASYGVQSKQPCVPEPEAGTVPGREG